MARRWSSVCFPPGLPYLCTHIVLPRVYCRTDGRWVVDDYYEDKVLEEITTKGLRPGDLVGELQEGQTGTTEVQALATVQKADRTGSGQGMYRAGGPTTIFGGSGWGPYSDCPLNVVRKSMLNHGGLNEENWIFVAAQRTAEASVEWARHRRSALRPCGGIFGDGPLVENEREEEREKERKKTKRKRARTKTRTRTRRTRRAARWGRRGRARSQ